MNNKRRQGFYLEDSLNNCQAKTDEQPTSSKNINIGIQNHQENNSRSSIILAGNILSAKAESTSSLDLCNTNIWCISDETLYRSLEPNLNKCVNLFNNAYLNASNNSEESDNTFKTENIDIPHLNQSNPASKQGIVDKQRSMSTDSLQDIIKKELKKSKSCTVFNKIMDLKRDTNYNLKTDQCLFSKTAIKPSHSEKVETTVSFFNTLSLSKPSTLPKKDFNFTELDQTKDSITSEKSSKEIDSLELRTLLETLENPSQETNMQQHLLKRLSMNCYESPTKFTEKLLTIIEESVINNDTQCLETSLGKFNEELQKMSKFIEDETIPEWPQSPSMSTSIYTKRRSQENIPNISFKSLASEIRRKTLRSTPVLVPCNIKSPKKIHRHISKNTCTTKDLHDSTNTFEDLEAYCKQLYPDEYKFLPEKEESSLQNMDNIRRICESQMASLEDTLNIQEKIKKAEMTNKAPEAQNILIDEEYDPGMDSKKISSIFKQQKGNNKHHEKVHDLENTLMYEIAQKRQRCLDTAKIMMELDANLEPSKLENTCSKIVDESSSTTSDKFMEILTCAKNYQDYLKEHKSVLNRLHTTVNSPCKRKHNVLLRTPKFSPRRKSPSSTKHRSLNKKPQFITPGKTTVTPSRIARPKRTYFTSMQPGLYKREESDGSNKKSIYAKSDKYDYVKSPVAMYIQGMASLCKNLNSKDEMIPKKTPTRRFLSPDIAECKLFVKQQKK